ncbi:MAG TPA: thiol reductant ABC exporter subunit CydC, partial [Bacillota bacterium]|nr:thiol reductant ABC exporter subunit CydC [Bacillota bacterium]
MNTWVFPYIRMFKTRIILSLLIGFIGLGSGAMLLFVSGYLISESALRPENIMAVYVPIVAVRAFSISRALFAYVEKLMSHDIVLRMLENMRNKLYDHLEPQAIALQETYQSGDLLRMLSDDIEHLQDFYLRTIFPSVFGLLLYGIICLVFGIFNWMFALFMILLFGVIVFFIPYLSLVRMRKQHESMKQINGELYSNVTDAFFGITDWKASNRMKELITQTSSLDGRRTKLTLKLDQFHVWRDMAIQVIISIGVISVMAWSAYTSDAGHIAPTLIAAFTLMIFSITEAFIPMSPAVEEIPMYQDAVRRMERLENNTEDTSPVYAPVELSNELDVTLNQVTFQYPQTHTPALKHVSLEIPQGTKLAVLGKSGAGKSTFMQLIAGVVSPTEGSVMMNGQPYTKDVLSTHIAVLNQKPHLFSTTIANNIRIGRPDATDEEVLQVAEQAQLTPLIESLPKGIHTNMLELG